MDFETSAIEKYTEIGREATRYELDQLSPSPDTEK